MYINKRLEEYKKSEIYPFHMPGHKRNSSLGDCYSIDMTEVDGTDDLHDPSDVIEKEQQELARIYGAEYSYILVGGSTVGNLAGIFAAIKDNSKVLIQRNSHKSVYNALRVRHARVEYMWPEINEIGISLPINPKIIATRLEQDREISAVIITSPTYDGYHSQIKEIADICHRNKVILIVDQAHGAHLGFHGDFQNGAAAYADITIQSMHKTLPALTQTALLHLNTGMVNERSVRQALDIFETSSPSYVLMKSVSDCVDILNDCQKEFDRYVDKLKKFYTNCGKLKHLRILQENINDKDPGKLVISTADTNITGVELAIKLRESYGIETEMASAQYVIAMTSIWDTKEGFDKLESALYEIDQMIKEGERQISLQQCIPLKKMEAFEAGELSNQPRELKDCVGEIAAETVTIYPPGIPLVVPGEIIDLDMVDTIKTARELGLHVTGLDGSSLSVVNC